MRHPCEDFFFFNYCLGTLTVGSVKVSVGTEHDTRFGNRGGERENFCPQISMPRRETLTSARDGSRIAGSGTSIEFYTPETGSGSFREFREFIFFPNDSQSLWRDKKNFFQNRPRATPADPDTKFNESAIRWTANNWRVFNFISKLLLRADNQPHTWAGCDSPRFFNFNLSICYFFSLSWKSIANLQGTLKITRYHEMGIKNPLSAFIFFFFLFCFTFN